MARETPVMAAFDRPLDLRPGPRLRRLRRDWGSPRPTWRPISIYPPLCRRFLERNQRPVTADVLLRLARTCKIDLADLAGDGGADHGTDAVHPEGTDVLGYRYPRSKSATSPSTIQELRSIPSPLHGLSRGAACACGPQGSGARRRRIAVGCRGRLTPTIPSEVGAVSGRAQQ